ncbi:MAG: ATP-binding protein, partial [Myxococcales bacterium]|nr:ATP-binding protein [Myxococcales bacterium]
MVAVDALPRDAQAFGDLLADLGCAAILDGAVLALRGDGWFDGMADDDPRRAALVETLDALPGPVALLVEGRPAWLQRRLRGLLALSFLAPDADRALACWRDALDDTPEGEHIAHEMIARFRALPGAIYGAVDAARRRAALDDGGALTAADVALAMEGQVEQALSGVADRVEGSLGWQDVVLPDEVREALFDLRAQARHRAQVFEAWGFRRKLDYGRGLGCLFSGPPGTGKTMMAGILARDLGLPLYRVDLSRVVSKWVGETEKNLARVFSEAERAQVILLFDEA